MQDRLSKSRRSWAHALLQGGASFGFLVAAGACTNAHDGAEQAGEPVNQLALEAQAVLDAHQATGQEFVGAAMALHDAAGGDALVTSGTTRPDAEGTAVDPDVPWVIGSATKTFVAVVVLQLAEEKKIDLDASLEPYFPSLPRASEISVRQLLQHTSGLNEYIDAPAVQANFARSWSPEELVAVAVGRGAVDEPGAAHHYANTNYILLGELIEQLTSQPWYESVHARILSPLGMQHTHYSGEPNAPAMGPGFSLENGVFVDTTRIADASIGGAAGGLQSTAPDLLRFAHALHEGSLLGAESWAQMTSFVPAEPRGYVGHVYGLGFEEYTVRDVTIAGHAGSAPAHGSFVGFDPQSGLELAVVANSSEPAPSPLMALEVVGALTGKDVSPPPASADPSVNP
ncbi:MAG TPA: serine hydrolase domain-containing protein [Polyangiaceae bacterium]|nr:serine hydrolase domain-containing protein [Polyangiaceae bacterium]